jgi:hypothetical protein
MKSGHLFGRKRSLVTSAVFLGALALFPLQLRAQQAGWNAVWGSNTTTAPAVSFYDATAYTGRMPVNS